MSTTQKLITLNNGKIMPMLGLGTFGLHNKTMITKTITEVNYRHIDTAAVQLNEEAVGDAIIEADKEGVSRDDLFVTTKVWQTYTSDPVKSLETSLSKLKMPYVDMFLVNWPISQVDPNTKALKKTPMYKIWAAMEKCLEKGMTKAIGVSNFNVQLIWDLMTYAEVKPACNQIELHPHLAQHELVDFLNGQGIVPVAYAPLSAPNRGTLFKNPFGTIYDDPVLQRVAEKHGISISQVALSWNMQRGVVVIPKTGRIPRAQENFDSQYVELDEEDIDDINSINKEHRVYDVIKWEKNLHIPAFK